MAYAIPIIPAAIREVVFPGHTGFPPPVEPTADHLVEELLEELLGGLEPIAVSRRLQREQAGEILDEEADRAFRTTFVLADEICSLEHGLSPMGEEMVATARGLRTCLLNDRLTMRGEALCELNYEPSLLDMPAHRAVLLIRRGRDIVAHRRAADLGRVPVPA